MTDPDPKAPEAEPETGAEEQELEAEEEATKLGDFA